MDTKEIEIESRVAVALAELLSKGWICQLDDSFSLTEVGFDIARQRWLQLTDENKALLGLYITTINAGGCNNEQDQD